MKIESLKDLEKLIKLCQKTGVYDIKVDNVEMHINPVVKTPQIRQELSPDEKIKIPQYTPVPVNPITNIPVRQPTEELSDEQKLFWSSEGTEAQ